MMELWGTRNRATSLRSSLDGLSSKLLRERRANLSLSLASSRIEQLDEKGEDARK